MLFWVLGSFDAEHIEFSRIWSFDEQIIPRDDLAYKVRHIAHSQCKRIWFDPKSLKLSTCDVLHWLKSMLFQVKSRGQPEFFVHQLPSTCFRHFVLGKLSQICWHAISQRYRRTIKSISSPLPTQPEMKYFRKASLCCWWYLSCSWLMFQTFDGQEIVLVAPECHDVNVEQFPHKLTTCS